MDSGKAFDKPLPSVEVLKKFQVSDIIDSAALSEPGPPLPSPRLHTKPGSPPCGLTYRLRHAVILRRSRHGTRSGRRRLGSATSSASEWRSALLCKIQQCHLPIFALHAVTGDPLASPLSYLHECGAGLIGSRACSSRQPSLRVLRSSASGVSITCALRLSLNLLTAEPNTAPKQAHTCNS